MRGTSTKYHLLWDEILSKVVLSGTGSASWYHLDNAVRRVFGADDERIAKLA